MRNSPKAQASSDQAYFDLIFHATRSR
jgi:hypothetical protein